MISLADLQRRIAQGDLSADAAIAQSLEAIAAQEKNIGAFVCHDPTNPRGKAPGRCAASRSASRTSWIPRTFRPRWAPSIYKGFRSRGDAAVVMALKAAGRQHHRQDHDDGVRILRSDRNAQSAQHGAYAGRIVGGFGRGGRGRHDPAGAGDADRRLGDPARVVLRLCRDQAVLSPAADGRRQMLFVDAGYGRAVRSRRPRCRARAGGDDRPGRIAAAGIRADAADRRGDAGFCRRAGAGRRRGAADRGEGGRARRRVGAHAGDAGDRCRSLARASERAGIRGASGAGLGIPRELRRDGAEPARTARREQGHDARRL